MRNLSWDVQYSWLQMLLHIRHLTPLALLFFFAFTFILTFVSISASLVCSLCSSIRLLLPIGNTVIHLDKAIARIREYERMKLKADLNPFDGAAASSSEASNGPPPPAYRAGAEGRRPELRCKDVYHDVLIHCDTVPAFKSC